MKILIYSKDNCTYCTQAKKMFNDRKLEFTEVKLGRDISREELIDKLPHGWTTMPAIYVDDEFIGGYTETYHYIKKVESENVT